VNPSLYRICPYDAERDLAPVTRGVLAPTGHRGASGRAGDRTIAELGGARQARAGASSPSRRPARKPDVSRRAQLEENTGARFTHVPYKGVGAAYADLVGGQVQFMFPDVASPIPTCVPASCARWR